MPILFLFSQTHPHPHPQAHSHFESKRFFSVFSPLFVLFLSTANLTNFLSQFSLDFEVKLCVLFSPPSSFLPSLTLSCSPLSVFILFFFLFSISSLSRIFYNIHKSSLNIKLNFKIIIQVVAFIFIITGTDNNGVEQSTNIFQF